MTNTTFVSLPPGFIAIDQYPGYFWHCGEKQLYTLKITGVLHKLKRRKGRFFYTGNCKWYEYDGYRISHKGRRKTLQYSDLLNLIPSCSIIPGKPEENE